MKTNKYGIEFAGPRRVKRGGWVTLLTALTVLTVITAMLWWLVSLVHRAATCGDVMPPMRMAGFGVPEWIAYGVLGTVVMSLLAVIAWNAIVGPRPAMEDGEGWGDKPVREARSVESGLTRRVPRCVKGCRWECSCVDSELEWLEIIVDPLEVGGNAIPPSEEMPAGLTRRDAAEIARAAAEIELCRRMVDGAMRALSMEDYDDALDGASRRLGQVRVTLRELGMTFDQGGIKA